MISNCCYFVIFYQLRGLCYLNELNKRMDNLQFLDGNGDEGIKGTSINNEEMTGKSIKCGKASVLRRIFREQFLSCDLLWNVFRSSLESYKFDSLLRPFPKQYINENGDKMVDNLREAAAAVTNLLEVEKKLEDGSLSTELINLLFWVLVESHSLNISILKKVEFSDVLKKVKNANYQYPNFIFKVDQSGKARTNKFNELAENYGVRFAFHGSRLENYFSILNHGLQVSLNKVAAFGPGVYLSSDLNVSNVFSPSGMTWSGSKLGSTLSIVALCEMIDHPDVKCQDDKLSSRKYAEGNRNTQVPKQYFIVQNSDLVRVNYLLVYTMPHSSVGITRWTQYGSISLIIIAYLILLFMIKLYNSPTVIRKINQFISKLY